MAKKKSWSRKHAIRFSKTLLMLSTALLFTLLAISNLVSTKLSIIFLAIIAVETFIAIYCWIATVNCFKLYKSKKFEWGLRPGIVGIAIGLVFWLVNFIFISSPDFAFSMFVMNGVVLLFLMVKDE